MSQTHHPESSRRDLESGDARAIRGQLSSEHRGRERWSSDVDFGDDAVHQVIKEADVFAEKLEVVSWLGSMIERSRVSTKEGLHTGCQEFF